MQIKELTDNVLPIVTILSAAFLAYNSIKKPEIKADKNIALIQANCKTKHENIDSEIKAIKENHLSHIETDVRELRENQVKIFTILDERLPKKEN